MATRKIITTMPGGPSRKRVLIEKANRGVVVVTSVAAFVVVFSLVAGHTLFNQMMYQNRIVSAKKETLKQLKADQTAAQNLTTAYQAFVSTSQNVLGGSPTGNGAQDGDNGKIVLDALPGQYDFPALATSLQKLLSSQNVKIDGISGTDDEVAQSQQTGVANPQPVAMPFQISVSGNYPAIQNVVNAMLASIRPMQIQSMTMSGDDANLSLSLSAQTFYQPQMTFALGSKEIK